MPTIERKAKRGFSELKAFYSVASLMDFVVACRKYNMPEHQCMLYLRDQTIKDRDEGKIKPSISDMAIRTYVWNQEALIGNVKNIGDYL